MDEKSFKGRINELYRESGLSIRNFAEKCGLSRQSMQYYLTGERMPDSTCLLKICEACSVSADWLLALTDVRTLSVDARMAIEYTGLPENMINRLKDSYSKEQIEALADLVETRGFPLLLSDYNLFITLLDGVNSIDEIYKEDDFDFKIEETGNKLIMNFSAGASLIGNRVSIDMAEICNQKKEYLSLGLSFCEESDDEKDNS